MGSRLYFMADEYEKPEGGYGKRPLWQWIIIYLIIGAIAYVAIYYFFFAQRLPFNY